MASIRDLSTKRAACLGAVTRRVNSIRGCLLGSVEDMKETCEDYVTKLLEAKSKFDTAHREVMGHPDLEPRSSGQYEDTANKATHSVVSVLDDYQDWIKTGPVVTIPETVGDRSVTSRCSGNELQESTLAMLEKLSLAITSLSGESIGAAVTSALEDQKLRHKRETDHLYSKIDALTKELHDVSRNPSNDNARPEDVTAARGAKVTAAFKDVDYRDSDAFPDTGWRNSHVCSSTRMSGSTSRLSLGRGRARGRGRGLALSEEPLVGGGVTQLDGSLALLEAASMMRDMMSQSLLQNSTMLASLQAPKVKISPFNGDPLQYTTFMTTFDELIHNSYDNDRTRLLLLLEHCEGKAKKLLEGCAHLESTQGYKEARRLLQSRYGNARVVTQAWMDRILAYPHLDDSETLEAFASDLESCRNSLSALGSLEELSNVGTLQLIVGKLPSYLRNKWRKCLRRNRDSGGCRVDWLVSLLREAAEDESDPAFCESVIARVRATYQTTSGNPKSPRQVSSNAGAVVHATDLWSGEEDEIEAELHAINKGSCAACKSGQHFTSRCKRYRDLSATQKLAFVKEKRLCLLCLADTHVASGCPLPWKCQEKTCGRRHHTSLHSAFESVKNPPVPQVNVVACPGEESDEDTEAAESYAVISAGNLPLVRVTLKYGERSISTYALLDPGATVTLCKHSLVQQLQAKTYGTKRMSLLTVSGRTRLKSPLTNFHVSEFGSNVNHPLFNAMVVEELQVSIGGLAPLDEIQSFPHLRDLRFHRGGAKSVGLLIGQNNAHLLEPIETVKGGLHDPYAVGTPVGWVLYGSTDEDYSRGDLPLPVPTGKPPVWTPGYIHSMGMRDGERSSGNDHPACSPLSGLDEEEEDWAEVHSFDNCQGEILFDELSSLGETCGEIYAGCDCSDLCLSESVKRMGELEPVPAVTTGFTRDEQYVWDLWEREMEIINGHIVLPIPFKSEPPELINNFPAAYRALMHLGRYLLAHEQERIQYRDAVYADFEEGHAEIIEDEHPAVTELVWYLLHHGIKHARKPNVTRVVKNGGAEYKGFSINKAAFKGPDLLNGLVDVLTGFRRYEVGATSDVKGMFNQVFVPERQQNYSRFLFWEDGDPRKKVIVCRMKTHTFGTVWAPAAANFALKKTGELFAKGKPEVAESISRRFYMDDWLDSQPTCEEQTRILSGVQATVAEGGFSMVKIASNRHEVVNSFPRDQRIKELAKLDVITDRLPRGVMLGQHWDPESDNFTFLAALEPRPFTRRGMTSCLASLFDPLGLVAPFLLPAKLLLQSSCRSGAGWDEELREDMAEHWAQWLQEFPEIEQFRLKRWFGCTKESLQYIHIFTDAAERAYGAVSYLAVRRGERSDTTLVTSKSKVSPPHRLTIPKMEMAGAVLGVRVLLLIKRMFGGFVQGYYLWVDSTIVLVLIRKEPELLKTFMGNRVSYIQQHTAIEQWGHVAGSDNPADLASRGEKISVLNNSSLWKDGPAFLKEDPVTWKKMQLKVLDTVKKPASSSVDSELKKQKPIFCGAVYSATGEDVVVRGSDAMAVKAELKRIGKFHVPDETENIVVSKLMESYSSWEKTVRLAVIIWRFADWWRRNTRGLENPRLSREMSVEEIRREEVNLLAWAQGIHISEETTKESPWKQLTPFYDDVLRVGGRFQFAELSTDVKHPIILPRDSPVTTLLIRDAHRKGGHGGPERTLLELRGQYWVIGGKPTVKRVTDTCILCKKLKARAAMQRMGPLPPERCDPGKPVFWHSGVDLFGPVTVIVKRSTVKRWGAVFTCLNSRAVHLEPIEDLSASAFIDTLERFTSRRVKPATLRSDNGTNFVSAEKEVSKVQSMLGDPLVQRAMTQRRIKWIFNAPAASHQGGVWERLIRSIRHILIVLLREHPVTDARFHTVLTMAEGIMNGRPLTRLTDDVSDLDPLTPGHFVYGGRLSPVFTGRSEADRLRQDWRLSQEIATELWDRWMAFYIPTLQRRSKWLAERENVRVNELVLVVCDQYHRYDWPLGVITEVHPGRDGLVRNVTLRTAKGTLTRPIQKIVRLELDVP